MNKKTSIPFILIFLSFLISSCDLGTNSDTTTEETVETAGTATLTGVITDSENGSGIFNATIAINSSSANTDSNGNYSIALSLDKSQKVEINVIKAGYLSISDSVLAVVGNSVPYNYSMDRDTSGTIIISSGDPASIVLVDQKPLQIGIRGAGFEESVPIIFEVRDPNNIPISEDKSVTVNFTITSSPQGAYLEPTSGVTDGKGRVNTSVSSGSVAGVVQLKAELISKGVVIESHPVSVSIHGGWPDSTHFHLASEQLNYHLLGVLGDVKVTAYVGDKYSNPVRLGTAVYFNATGSSIIQGSSLDGTDESGKSSVSMINDPDPNHTVFGRGFIVAQAKTVNENYDTIKVDTKVLISGNPNGSTVSLTPGSFNIPNNGAVSFVALVQDVYNNALVNGSTVTIKLDTKGSAELIGQDNFKFPDTQNKTAGTIYFTVIDSDTAMTTSPLIISIEVKTPTAEFAKAYTGVTN